MKKVIIIDHDITETKEDILEKLFSIREQEIEKTLKIREEFIKEKNLKEITQRDINNEIKSISSIDLAQQEKIISMIDKLLDNKLRIHSFDCKLYYEAGIQDIVEILFSEKRV